MVVRICVRGRQIFSFIEFPGSTLKKTMGNYFDSASTFRHTYITYGIRALTLALTLALVLASALALALTWGLASFLACSKLSQDPGSGTGSGIILAL